VTDQEQQLPPSQPLSPQSGAPADASPEGKTKKRFGRSPAFYVAVVACVAMIVGGFGTWFTVGPFSLSGTGDGISDGWRPIVVAIMSLGLLALFAASRRGWLLFIVAALGIFATWYCIRDISDAADINAAAGLAGSTASVSAAWGLYVAAIASGLLVISSLVARFAAPRQ
jgi:hypothetical protein